ncbi:hypothetical protein SCUP234_02945 [Seiridium cupressi]
MGSTREALKYTTVGSIANPNSAPLQPPARRGRTVKWPLHTDFGLVSSPLSGLPFSPDSRSPPSDNQPLHYSPLQQNTDRAVSPTVDSPDCNASIISLATMLSARALGHGEQGDTNLFSQADDTDDEDPDDYGTLKQMPVKTLTNLASYENPKQKIAQKILSRARAFPLQTARAQSIRSQMAGMVQSDGTVDPDSKTVMYSSILSKRPGAPRPLTAGPPGLRQHKSSTFECSMPERRSTALPDELNQASQDSSRDSLFDLARPSVPEPPSRRTYPALSLQETFRTDTHRTSKMFDTLSPDNARGYYRNGLLPANFNHQSRLLTATGEHNLPPRKSGVCIDDNENRLLARRARIDAIWSEGTKMFGTTMDQALTERRYRDLEMVIGRVAYEGDATQKAPNREMSVQEANQMSAEDHAAPLLSMAFQTLINFEAFTLSGNLPKLEYREL